VAEWSPNGEFIAYINTLDEQLHLYSIATGQSEFLTKAKPDAKKKK
jgi:hypothetical protein